MSESQTALIIGASAVYPNVDISRQAHYLSSPVSYGRAVARTATIPNDVMRTYLSYTYVGTVRCYTCQTRTSIAAYRRTYSTSLLDYSNLSGAPL